MPVTCFLVSLMVKHLYMRHHACEAIFELGMKGSVTRKGGQTVSQLGHDRE
jgi:hypothetical protein